jgi:hypothetical protein
MLSGVLALVCGVGAWHAARVRMPGSGVLLNWLDEHGLVRAPDMQRQVEVGNPGVILITDGGAIEWLLIYSLWFAMAAMLLALRAEFKREDTLLLSAGFICGALAVFLYSPLLALVAIVAGAAALAYLRRGQHA